MRRSSGLGNVLVILSLVAIGALDWAGPAQAANWTWNGNTDPNWDTAANWNEGALGNNTPVFGTAGTSGTTLLNDMTADNSIAGITFSDSASAFTIDGNSITLNGNITVGTGITTETINLPMILNTNPTVTVNSGVLTLGGAISQSGARNLTKQGLGTLVLSGANTWTGTTTVSAGTLKIVSGVTEPLPTSGLTLGGTLIGGGTFIYDNAGATGTTTLTLPTVTFGRALPNDNVVQITRTAAQNVSLVITNMTAQNIENGHNVNFVISDVATGGVNGTDYKIVLGNQTAYKIAQTNVYFNGSDFAVYDAGPDGLYTTPGDGFVRGIKYGVDASSATSAGGASFAATTSQEITGNITAQPSVTLANGTLNGSLKIVGESDLTMLPGATLTFNGAGNTGTGGILKTGGGTSYISGGDAVKWNYDGQTDFRVDAANDTLDIAMPLTVTVKCRLMKSGAGTLVLSGGTTTFTDGRNVMWVNDGIWEIGGTATFKKSGAGSGIVLASGASFKHSSSSTASNVDYIQGTGGVTVTNGTLTLTGNNTYTGTTTIGGSGTLLVGAGGTTGSISTSAAIANDGALVFNVGGATTVNGAISGSGTVTQNGAGTLTFTGANTHTGDTILNSGVLQLSPSGANTMLVKTITRGAGGGVANFTPGSGVIQTTAGDTNGFIGGWATYNSSDWAIGSSDGSLANVTAATYTNTSVALDDPDDYTGNNMNVDSSQAPTGLITPKSLRFNTAGAYTLTLQGGNTITGGGILVGAGVGGNLSTITGGTLTNDTELIVIQNNTNTAGSLEIASAITGDGAVSKYGNGTLILSGASDYSGGTAVIGGTLRVSDDSNLGAAGTTVTLAGGSKLDGGAATLTIARPIILGTGGGVFTNATGGDMTVTGSITSGGPLSLAPEGDVKVNSAITTTWPLSVSGTGTATLTGTSNLTGASGNLQMTGGSLVISDGGKLANAGTANSTYITGGSILVTGSGSSYTQNSVQFNINSGTVTIEQGATANFNAALWWNTPGNATLNVDDPGSQVNITGKIQMQSGNSTGGVLNITNGGKVIVSDVLLVNDDGNSKITIDGTGSLLQLGSALQIQAKGNGGGSSVTVKNGGTLTSVGSSYVSNTNSIGNNIVTITGAGSSWINTALISVASATGNPGNTLNVTLGGLVQSSSLTVGAATTTANTITADTGGILQFNMATPAIIIGAGSSITMNGATLSYKGVTGVDMNKNTTGTGTVNLFTWTGSNSLRLDGSTETGIGAYSFGGTGTNYAGLELYGASSITRAITIDGANGGKLLLNGASANLTGGVTLSGNATVTATGTASSLTGVITGAGSLVKAGTGTLTLESANDYSGATVVTEGTLSIKNLGSGLADLSTVEIYAGAFLDLNFTAGTSDQIAELWMGGSGPMAPGFYDYSNYPSYFTGTGSLHVIPIRLPGDADENGVVDAADYIIVKQNFGRMDADWSQGNFTFDTDGDSNVDWDDLQILMAHFSTRTIGEAPAVPEPATLGLLSIGALAVIRRRHRA